MCVSKNLFVSTAVYFDFHSNRRERKVLTNLHFHPFLFSKTHYESRAVSFNAYTVVFSLVVNLAQPPSYITSFRTSGLN